MSSVLTKMRPEILAGGFARDDGLVALFSRVNALLTPDMVVVDLGCGRGVVFDQTPLDQRALMAKLQGRVRKVIGIDVDAGVMEHPHLDERMQIKVGDPLPVADESVDVIVSDWVLEHIADPAAFVTEIRRVLKPGGWFCARTPNRWGYVGMAASLVPNSAHTRLLSTLMPGRQEQDVFPTCYKLNTMGAIERHFAPGAWRNHSFVTSTTPKYFGRSALLFRLIDIYQNLVPDALQTNLMVFVQKQ